MDLMKEVRGRIVWAMMGFYGLYHGISEIVIRYGVEMLGMEEITTMFNGWIVELVERSWVIPWFLIIVGAWMICASMFYNIEYYKNK